MAGEWPRFEAAQARRLARDGADVTEEVRALNEELRARRGDRTERPPTRREQIGAVTYDELLDDRQLLDRVARAVCLNCDVDYMEAFERLEVWRDQARVTTQRTEVTLAELLDESVAPISLDTLCRDVLEMERADTVGVADAAVDVVEVETSDAKVEHREISAEDLDGAGKVRLLERSDRAFLLTDAYTIERAYLRAKEIDPHYADRDVFDADYRALTEAGVDFIANLEWHYGAADRQAAIERTGRERRQMDREQRERRRRAEERKLEREIEDRRRRL